MNTFFSLLLVTTALFIPFRSALSEYRLYQYFVSPKEGRSSVVTSALDPVSYVSFHGGKNSTRVDLLRTWICPGYTGKKAPCPSPYSRIPDTPSLLPSEPLPPSLPLLQAAR